MSVNTVTNQALKWVPTKASCKQQFAGITLEKHWAIWIFGVISSLQNGLFEKKEPSPTLIELIKELKKELIEQWVFFFVS